MGFTLGTVFNEGTDWEFTVSNETLAEAVQAEGGITEADIADYCYVALIDSRVVAMLAESTRNSNDGLYPWAMEFCAAYNTNNGAHPSKVQMNVNQKEQNPVTCYQRNIITYYGTIGAKAGHFLVMDMANIKKWIMDYDVYPAYSAGTVTSTTGFPGYTGACYVYNEANVARVTPYQAEGSPTSSLFLMNVFATEDTLWIGSLNPTAHSKEKISNEKLSHAAFEFDFAAADIYNAYYTGYIYQAGSTPMQGWSNFPDAEFPDPPGNTTVFASYLECDDSCDSIIKVSGQYGNSQNPYITNCEQGNIVKTLHGLHTVESWGGLLFKDNNVIYKPIIEGGLVTGFTSDMDIPSEWDDMTNVTGNDISPTPPSPGPTPGYDDDPWHGVSFSGVGVGGAGAFAKCYYMTSTELSNLRSWMNSNNVPEGFDPMQQIIGLSQVPVSLSGDDNTTVQFVNSSAVYDPGVTRLVDSGVSTQISMGTPKRYSLGSVNITRRMQERGEPYLDYDCQIELYLPLIGMFSLDTQAVMGRTITAEAVLDPISGTLAAYAYVSRDGQNLPIAYGSTTIGVDLPISAQQYSVSRAALKQANAQLGASILSSTLSFIAAATAGGKGSGTGAKTATGTTNGLAAAGIREAGADYMKASQAGNVFGDFMQWGRTIRQLSYGNNTAIAGSFGGSTAQWSYPFTPYVKIIRPRYEKPSNYAHSQGVPCVQTKKVGSCTGFIQCIGVDVSGISGATDLELQAIQAALSNGIFAGGGQ